MHAKTDSDVTSLAASSPPRSPPRRPAYYVMSPSHSGSSLGGSPHHHFAGGSGSGDLLHHHQYHLRYLSSPIHHSRESSTTRYSASLKHAGPWRKLPNLHVGDGRALSADFDDVDEEDGDDGPTPVRCYVLWFVVGFVVLFSLFSIILWGASKSYKPEISVKSVVFQSYNVQAGSDLTGVPTKMLSINSTVRIRFRNPASFFAVHVSSTPLDLYYYGLMIASGNMEEFYQRRKSGRVVTAVVLGEQVPLYGGGSALTSRGAGGPPAVVPLDLVFVMRARANVLGHLVRSKFHRRIRCSLVLRESRLGKPVDLRNACEYHE